MSQIRIPSLRLPTAPLPPAEQPLPPSRRNLLVGPRPRHGWVRELPGFFWQFQATCGYLPPYELLPFCMSGQHIIISSVSPWIFYAFPNVLAAPSQRKKFVEPGHARILAWLSFLLACHITQVPCSGTTNSADLEVIKHRVHHGWLVLLNAKFGQVLWSRNQEDLFIYSYSLWCMGRMGMVPQLFLKSIHLLSGPR